jgi:2-polyprenyl-3-methyl-5-hydroxy-6-metoxy-1,4-benzoquinol methylase
MSRYQSNCSYRAELYENYGKTFQGAPDHFDLQAANRWGRAYDYYFRGWLPESKTARIADLACGYGRLLHFFRLRGYRHLTGVDISPDQVKRATEVHPNVHEGNVLDFLEQHCTQFDLIVALDLIEHLTKGEVLRFLRGCLEALRPGGRLVLQTPNADSPFGMASRYNDLTHEVCFNFNALSRLLVQIGAKDVMAREAGPVPIGYSAISTARWFVWQAIRGGILLWNLAETGSAGSKVLTRNVIVSAVKGTTS